ncbi:MAG: CvpA family protein [Chitinispirillales bacterium]|jgi:membrane protein required for colicin V production|nr:CvpA family protein [Chitinispirillales bacterium]
MSAAFFDMVIGVLAIVFGVLGAKRGLISEVFRFAAFLAGFFVAFLYYRDLQGVMGGFAQNRQFVALTAFIVLFIAVFILITLTGFLLRKFTDAVTLGWVDHICGLLFGLLKVGVIAWAACLSIASLPIQKIQDEFARSVVYKGYKTMPKSFSLDSMENMRRAILGRDVGGHREEESEDEEEE